ncbi:TfoX domain containing protein [Pseudoduganella sp. FT25W]|uniref:TfoX domain containing protein n=1 Tax=Duganella alba TaxID=2666081 RepID=A0A6L5QBV8_9BURK|nr:TfoX/Sxy family protein [Duganella alba]MRX07217.1 TfoX domain containing protein [Duganella alba]MRX15088.1 TfoX domain containing protein [Duganella alba]
MAANAEFVSYIQEQLAPLGALTTSPFFGGRAIKYRGQQFAWIIGSTLYLRVDDATRADFEAEGAQPFKYTTKKGEVTVRKFYTAPEFLLDDPEQLLGWSRRAIEVAAD